MARGFDRPLYIQPFDHRTVFRDALVAWRAGKATREQTVAQIAGRYREFADLFAKSRHSSDRPA